MFVSKSVLIWSGIAFLFLYASVASGSSTKSVRTSLVTRNNYVKTLVAKDPSSQVGDFECQICVQFAVAAINRWMNDYLNRIMLGSCDQLCNLVAPNDTDRCFFICTIHGFFYFIEFLKGADINPIYMCQHPAFHNGCLVAECTSGKCVEVLQMDYQPKVIPRMGQFEYSAVWQTHQVVGAGTVSLRFTLDEDPEVQEGPFNTLIPSFQPGIFRIDYALEAREFFKAGTYTASFTICEGYCGSKFPHTRYLDQKNLTITIQP